VPRQARLPPLLSREAFVEQSEDFWDVELDIFQVQVFLVVLLHLEEIVEFEIKLEQSTIPA
jgi:hypothetical protein